MSFKAGMPAGCYSLDALYKSRYTILCDESVSSIHAIAPHALLVRNSDGYTDQLREVQYGSGNYVAQLHLLHIRQDLVCTLHELHARLLCQSSFQGTAAVLQLCTTCFLKAASAEILQIHAPHNFQAEAVKHAARSYQCQGQTTVHRCVLSRAPAGWGI